MGEISDLWVSVGASPPKTPLKSASFLLKAEWIHSQIYFWMIYEI
jgi:hypothetical protein